jgi:hypothetical protein
METEAGEIIIDALVEASGGEPESEQFIERAACLEDE